MGRLKTISGFIHQYTALTVLTVISAVIAITYVFTSNLTEWFPFAGEIFALINALGLAIIANCIFCYFQIYLPECRGLERVRPLMQFYINKILRLIDDPYERMYHEKTKQNLEFDMIPEDELKTLFNGIDPMGYLGYKYGLYDPAPTRWIVYKYIEDAQGEIERFIGLFEKYLDADLFSLLIGIHQCSYFTKMNQYHNSGALDEMANIGPSEDLVPLQQLYKRLKEYVLHRVEVAENMDQENKEVRPQDKATKSKPNEKHLEFLQNNIARMNQCSFQMKGWSITIASALIAVFVSTISDQNPGSKIYLLAAIAATILFWCLDSLYLSKERRFIGMYNDLIGVGNGANQPVTQIKEYEIPVKKYGGWRYSIFWAMVSPSELLLYGVIIAGLFYLCKTL